MSVILPPDQAESCTVARKRKEIPPKKNKVSSNWLQMGKKSSKAIGKRNLHLPHQNESIRKKQKVISADLPSVTNEDKSITKYIGLDCEMVGVGHNGEDSALAQVVIVNSHGNIIYNKYVKPNERVIDFRTSISGIRPEHIVNAPLFEEVQKEVAEIIVGKIIVGHSLENDFKALLLSHPFVMTRDTAKYRPLQRKKNKPHSLKWLAKTHLGVDIQTGEHSPDVDARAALLIYNKMKKDWEAYLKAKRKKKFSNSRVPKKKKKETEGSE